MISGNPFNCEWLVKEALTSKNLRLCKDSYVVNSKQNVQKVAGILCFHEDGENVQRLIVVERRNDEMSTEVS